jgi:hypothetical protein
MQLPESSLGSLALGKIVVLQISRRPRVQTLSEPLLVYNLRQRESHDM